MFRPQRFRLYYRAEHCKREKELQERYNKAREFRANLKKLVSLPPKTANFNPGCDVYAAKTLPSPRLTAIDTPQENRRGADG
jgi:hypothetical protein